MLRKIKSVIVLKSKDWILCIISAILLILSFPNFNFWLLAWFGFVPLLFAIKNKSKGQAFLFSYLTGVIFWFGIIYWLIHVTLPGMIIFVLYLAVYFGIFGLIVCTYPLPTTHYPLFIPSLWVILEFVRSHFLTGFPWALLGYSQYLNLPAIQIADITGAWGVSFLVMLANVAVFSLISQKSGVTSKIKKCFMPLLAIIVVLAYGYYKLNCRPPVISQRPAKISVIQGNILQELKWDRNSRDFIMDRYFDLSADALEGNPDLIIWPEAALPVVLEEEPLYYGRVKDFVKEAKTPLLFGAVSLRDNFYYNSAILIFPEGRLLLRYDKLHLVPFGEYIPLRKIFGFLESVAPIGDFSRGKEYAVFNLPIPATKIGGSANLCGGTDYRLPITFSVLICFEDLFPELSREFIRRGADFLINITNDAWFKKTSSPYQHLCASVFRAVENRVFLVRSANTGISGFIAPTGKIISLVTDEFGNHIFISGYKSQQIPVAEQGFSFYTRYGDFFVIACILFILVGVIFRKKL